MSLNEEYLDELLKAVTTEENVSKKQPVLNKSSEEKEITKSTSDIEQDNIKGQEKRHTFSEDDLTEMLEHLEEIDASTISDVDISKEVGITVPVKGELAIAELSIADPIPEEKVNVEQIEDNASIDKSLSETDQSIQDSLQGAGENNLFDAEDNVIETKDNKTEIDEAASMAESAEYLSDIEELLKNIEESAVEPPEDMMQESNTDGFNDDFLRETDSTETDSTETGATVTNDTVAEQETIEVEKAEVSTQEAGGEESLDGDIFGDGIDSGNEDIMSLLGAMDDNGELAEIGDLLQKDENHEEIENDDMMAILEQAAELEKQNDEKADYDFTGEDRDPEGDKKKKRFGKKKVKKVKKIANDNAEDAEPKGVETKEKKKSFFAKILNLFFEEEEEDIEDKIPGVGEEGATDENLAILEELSNEKPGKKKKEKKPKEPKKVKEKKPKKEKQPKEPREPQLVEKLEKKIPKKKIIRVVIFAISILIVLLIVVIIIPNKIAFQNATKAYEEQDYKSAYKELAGMNLNDNEKFILKKVSTILELQEKYEAYVNFDKMDMKIEALNSLLQGIDRYDKSISYADKMNVSTELDLTYQQIVSALNQNYGISEEEARKIIAYDKVTYTKKLDSIVNGTEFVDPNAPVEEQETLEDMLPEELMMQEVKKSETTTEVTTEITTEANTEATTEENKSSNSIGETVNDANADTNDKELYRGNVSGNNGSVDFSK